MELFRADALRFYRARDAQPAVVSLFPSRVILLLWASLGMMLLVAFIIGRSWPTLVRATAQPVEGLPVHSQNIEAWTIQLRAPSLVAQHTSVGSQLLLRSTKIPGTLAAVIVTSSPTPSRHYDASDSSLLIAVVVPAAERWSRQLHSGAQIEVLVQLAQASHP